MPSMMIVGASGLVGSMALERMLASPRWSEVVAVSRRMPEIDTTRRFTHLAVDLKDRDATRRAFEGVAGRMTHVAYAALYEQPGLVAGWQDQEQMTTNLSMLQNCIDPLAESGMLRHVSIMQGGKAYGAHLHAVPITAREEMPRDRHENFYWLQEDYLEEKGRRHRFDWTVLRARLVLGRPWGTAMNIIPVLGAYAALCREQGRPFAFPGGHTPEHQATDTRLLADVLEWAALAPAAANERFNVDNGDIFEWRQLWPDIAGLLGVDPAPDAPFSMAEFFDGQEEAWASIRSKYWLRPISLRALLGESHHFAYYAFRHRMERGTPVLTSGLKLRQAGFQGCCDTRDSFAFFIRDLAGRRVIPGPHAYAANGVPS